MQVVESAILDFVRALSDMMILWSRGRGRGQEQNIEGCEVTSIRLASTALVRIFLSQPLFLVIPHQVTEFLGAHGRLGSVRM